MLKLEKPARMLTFVMIVYPDRNWALRQTADDIEQ